MIKHDLKDIISVAKKDARFETRLQKGRVAQEDITKMIAKRRKGGKKK